jgi:hypothetical protein
VAAPNKIAAKRAMARGCLGTDLSFLSVIIIYFIIENRVLLLVVGI